MHPHHVRSAKPFVQYADTARAAERRFMEAGVNAVPGFALDGRHLTSGAQPPATLADVIRQVASEAAGQSSETA